MSSEVQNHRPSDNLSLHPTDQSNVLSTTVTICKYKDVYCHASFNLSVPATSFNCHIKASIYVCIMSNLPFQTA